MSPVGIMDASPIYSTVGKLSLQTAIWQPNRLILDLGKLLVLVFFSSYFTADRWLMSCAKKKFWLRSLGITTVNHLPLSHLAL